MNDARSYYVDILASRHHGTLYIGITNDIRTRIEQHRAGRGSEYVQKYRVFALCTWRYLRLRKKRSRGKSS